ncbi:UNVERIFIED_CONTAM: ToMV resistance protein Tm-2(2) [Sesamum angustifolium]|uniref:ToMV resistance protein Tm-2(2) n=1 Tax=Sesamum angustifolium TaxID=2727405 RepID=A0AAW2Q9Q0_9LAMI
MELANYLSRLLRNRKYLIVLDDIWSNRTWDELQQSLPHRNTGPGSRIMLTSKVEEVGRYASKYSRYFLHKMQLLNEKENWHLLSDRVFGKEHSCPPQLEEAGKKIAEKCEGLPLAIIAVGKHLSIAERTTEYWNKVAERESSIIISADEDLSKALYLSYNHLPQCLKACFIYIGVFPPDNEIPASKLIKLWCADGFLEPNPSQT